MRPHLPLATLVLLLIVTASANAQLAWQRVGADLADTSFVAVRSAGAGRVYALSWSESRGNRLHRSSDDGATWRTVDATFPGSRLWASPDGSIYTVTTRLEQGPNGQLSVDDLMRSSDGGETWSRFLEGWYTTFSSNTIWDVAFGRSGDVHVAVHVYAATSRSGLVMRRRLSESSWDVLYGGHAPISLAVRYDGVVAAGIDDRDDTGLLGGAIIASSGPDTMTVVRDSAIASAMAFSAATTLVADIADFVDHDRVADRGIRRSTNDGRLWLPTTGGIEARTIVVAADASLVAGSHRGVIRSTDDGSTWSRVDGGLPGAIDPDDGSVTHPVAPFTATDRGSLIVPTYRGLYRALLPGFDGISGVQLEWAPIAGPPGTAGVQSIFRGYEGFFAWTTTASKGSIWWTSDYGRSWRPFADSLANTLSTWVAPDGTLFQGRTRTETGGGGTLQREDLYRSIDSGRTWTRVNVASSAQNLHTRIRELVFDRDGEIYLAMIQEAGGQTGRGEILRSTDDGATWESLFQGDPVSHVVPGTSTLFGIDRRLESGHSYSRLIGPRGRIVLDSFRLFSGVHSTSGAFVVSGASVTATPSPNTLYDRGMRRSLDSGVTWRLVDGSPTAETVIALPSGWLLALGRTPVVPTPQPTVLLSTDDGLTWTYQGEGLDGFFNGIVHDRGFVFVNDGGIIRRASIAPELTPRVHHPVERVRMSVPAKYQSQVPADRWLWVPKGWTLRVFHAGGLAQPRFLAWGPDSVLHVANLRGNYVLAMPDRNRDGVADTAFVAAEEVGAHDIEFFRGAMYAAEMTRVLKLVDADGDGRYETRSVFIDGLPESGHFTRTIVIDSTRGTIFVSVGSACNACRDSAHAVIYAFDLDGGNRRIYATGIRNAVGMTQHPTTGRLWATNNGQDLAGDDIPPEFISVIRENGDYGFPLAHSDRRWFDFDINDEYRRMLPITPADSARVRGMAPFGALVTAHSAPMAIEFADPSTPAPYRSGAFVALRGSWNRTVPSGYKLIHLDFDRPGDTIARAMSYVLAADTAEVTSVIDWMRPVGLESDSRGNLYFTSDDRTQLVGVLSPPGGLSGIESAATPARQLSVHPNPAVASAVVSIDLARSAHCTIEIVDARGTRVLLVEQGERAAGNHRFRLDTRDLPSGAYQVRLTAGDLVETHPLVIQR